MRKSFRAALVAAALLALPSIGRAQMSVVVAASDRHTATKEQIADMFSGASTTWADGSKVQIVDQADSDVGHRFYEVLVKRPVSQARAQWTKLALSGQALAPRRAMDDAAVKEMVKRLPGAIGYVATSSLDASVREIARVQ